MASQRSNPFLSPLGCGSALTFLLGLAAVLAVLGQGIFNPGPLSASEAGGTRAGGFASHAEFEGQCEQCHTPFRAPHAQRCEACHTAVAEQRATRTGLHGMLAGTGRCANCHTEHLGREARITSVDLTDFDHAAATGFSLARHALDYDGAPLACAGCHRQGRFTRAMLDCVECHTAAEPDFAAEHRALFGDDCLACHDGLDSAANFDHALVFPLEGGHAGLECAECHAERRFAGTPTECVACHAEPAIHLGLFDTGCVSCHTVQAWSPALLTEHTFPLDHGLENGQPATACRTCHETSFAQYTCYNCHEHEPQDVQDEHAEEGIFNLDDCAECHPTGTEDEAEDREGRAP